MKKINQRKIKSKAATQLNQTRAESLQAKHPLLPKLIQPRPTRLYLRERLFGLLDRTRENHRVIWVSAPGGGGKTSLISTYIECRTLRAVWYQVDAGDGDVASFFYYMGLAVQRAAPRHRKPLPLLSPEYLGDVPTFTRNFFRELYSRLPERSVIVLDNYQEAPEDSPLHDVLRIAMSEAPEGTNLFVLSRAEPPTVLARLRLCDHAACLDWDKLRLTPEETTGISELRLGKRVPDSDTLSALHQRAHGWAAGLVLMLEQARRGGSFDTTAAPANQQLLFDYFAGEILSRSDPAVQDFLLKTALFSKVTVAAAQALTGTGNAKAILDDLTRRNYFTVRNVGNAQDSYEYHPLFREFLRVQAQALHSPAALEALRREAARILVQAGEAEEAVVLLQQSQSWAELSTLICANAPALIAQGRWKTLVEWIQRLPASVREASPDVAYWSGVALLPFDPQRARAALSVAYHEFKKAGAVEARWRAWCGVVDTFVFEWRDFHPLDEWIDEIENEPGRYGDSVPAALDAQVASGMFMALMNRHPQHPDMERWAQRAWDLAIGGADPVLRIKTGPHLLLYYTWWIGDLPKAELLLNALRPYAEDTNAPPLVQATWCAMAGAYYWMNAENPACVAIVERGLGLADTTGVHVWDTLLCGHGAFATLTSGQLELAQIYIRRMGALQDPARAMDSALYYYLSGSLYYSQGDQARALEHAKTAVDMAEAAGAIYQTGILRNDYGRMLYYAGNERDARAAIEQALATSREMRSPSMEYLCYLAQAEIALRRGEEEPCRTALTRCLQIGRQQGYRNHTWWNAELMAQLYARALEHNIEVPYVQEQIRCRALAPPVSAESPETWPWTLRIHTFGRFALVRDGKPVKFEVRTQKRALELLKALVAFGGREVSEQKLCDALWPGTEADDARVSLKITLHRLRGIIGHDAILLRESKLTLDTRSCWVDTWSFERHVNRLTAIGTTLTASEAARLGDRLLSLYGGAFLGDDEQVFALPARERLRGKWMHAIAALAGRFQRDGAHDRAIAWYERGIEIEPLAESFYQNLMRVYQTLHRPAEGLGVYRRCKKILLTQLQINPSPETEALAQALRALGS